MNNTQTLIDAPNHLVEFAPELDRSKVLWTELFPGGGHWSYRVRRGTSLRFVDLEIRTCMHMKQLPFMKSCTHWPLPIVSCA